jgi:hypothetical protein
MKVRVLTWGDLTLRLKERRKKNRCEKSAAVVVVTDHHEGPN